MQEYRFDETPEGEKWRFLRLYKPSLNNKLSTWQIGFNSPYLEITHGFSDGEIRTDRTEVNVNSSGREIIEQAILEARQRYTLKYRDGYRPAGETSSFRKPMTAYAYEAKRLANCWPVYVQPKLDGIRLLVLENENGVNLISRTGGDFNHLQSIKEEMQSFFVHLPRGAMVDGELYSPNLNFTEITSIVKTRKTIHKRLEEIYYYIFDLSYQLSDQEAPPYEDRYQLLVNAHNNYCDTFPESKKIFVLPCFLANSEEEIKQYHLQFLEEGYEGLMVKKLANSLTSKDKEYKRASYQNKRCFNIMKLKNFFDEEATILSVKEGEGTEKGVALLEVKDQKGNVFVVRPRGTFEVRKEWFQNPKKVIGKKLTIRFQERSVYGVPRFPIAHSIRDYEG